MDISNQNQEHRAYVALGGWLEVTIRELPSSGYLWRPQAAPGLKVTDLGFGALVGAETRLGAGGLRHFGITGLALGLHLLSFINEQPWPKGKIGGKTSIEITVRKD